VRTLDPAVQGPLGAHWNAVFRRIREFFGPAEAPADRALRTARAHMLIETLFWLPVWIGRYSEQDFPRVRARLLDVLEHGLALPGASWNAAILTLGDLDDGDAARAQFLNAATRLISERGYGGASVERIVAELKVTKGAFYHHLDAKDDLVLSCFERSYQRVSDAQWAADEAGGDQWRRLNATIATLLNYQLGGEWPLLRSTALLGLPQDVRAEMVERASRMALRFAGTLSDGIAEGSIRAVDPMIASQVVIATLNSAWELRNWAAGMGRDAAIELYASTLSRGLLDPDVVPVLTP
jgi:AcrR family transcriptional regulator